MKQRDGSERERKWKGRERKLLQECWNCHAVGLKPGILETHHGDYGMRNWYGGKFLELPLDERSLCPKCAADPPPDTNALNNPVPGHT